MHDVSGKHIWIIGASSGIGAALATELARRGAVLALSARRKDKLDELVASLEGSDHIAVSGDVSDAQSLKEAQDQIMSAFPAIDSAVFMAAIYGTHDWKPKTLEFIHDMLRVNIGGAFNMMDGLLPVFKMQGQGQVVLCASVAGYRGLPSGQPYCATKAALISMAESWKTELEPQNIDVKVICPGFVKTPLTDKNNFPMPMMIEAEQAARAIANGMCRRSFEIHFPRRFTFIMKALRLMPSALYFWIARHLSAASVKGAKKG